MDNKIVTVAGATGQQGGSVARHLLAAGWPVRALTRDPQSERSQVLKDLGAEVMQADFSDAASLSAAFKGAYAVFSVQLPDDVEKEVQDGRRMAELAKAANIQHFIYSSVGGAERETGIAHFESKWQIEMHIKQLNMPHSILRPAYFMDNFKWKRNEMLEGRLTSMGLPADKTLQMIASQDIGAFARIVLENPDQYLGQAIEIAGDEVTEKQIAAILSIEFGHEITLVPPEGPILYADMQDMYDWFISSGFSADIPHLRNLYPSLSDFKTWAASHKWK